MWLWWLVGCAPVPCLGSVDLCERALPEVTLAASHNAMSNAADGWALPNQSDTMLRQLQAGVRGMLIDTRSWEGEAWLCHGYCELGARPLRDALVEIDLFLEAHPGEVLVLVVQDSLSIEDTEAAFSELMPRVIVPPAGDWPTLGELVREDRRLLVTRESSGPGPDWYRPFYELGFDTPYDFQSVDEMSCDVLRGEAPAPFFLINHWISDPFPSAEAAAQVNRADVLEARVADCRARWGRAPSLIAVDFQDLGDLRAVVDRLNGLPPSRE